MLASHNLRTTSQSDFGIDQILSCPEPPEQPRPGSHGPGPWRSAAFSGGFHGASKPRPAASLAPVPSGSGVGPGGVIRVPAHRRCRMQPPAGEAPAVPGPSGLGGAGGLAGLTFPWWTAAAMPGTGSRVRLPDPSGVMPHTDPVFSHL